LAWRNLFRGPPKEDRNAERKSIENGRVGAGELGRKGKGCLKNTHDGSRKVAGYFSKWS